MRGRSLVAILGAAGICVLAVAAAVWISAARQETAGTSIVVDIPDNPAALAASKAQEAEVVAALPGTAEETPQASTAPAAPEKLFIVDTIRVRMQDPALRQGAHPDDLAALETFYAQHSGPALWVTGAGLTPEAQSIIGEIGKADEWGLSQSSFVVPPADYQPTVAEDQAAAEIAVTLGLLKYARAARGGTAVPKTLNEIFAQKPTLREPATVLTEIVVSPTPDAYLRDLHPKHAQFVRLQQALMKAKSGSEPTKEEDIKRVEANMERWRWMPEDLGTTYVLLNIPEFMLEVVKDGKVVETEKVVVGSPSSPTPVLSADMQSIVFNPERVVPLSIIRKDVLPKLRESGGLFGGGPSSILERYQLTVKNRGRVIDPDKIDWATVDLSKLTFVQAPGPTNVLGKVQFLYPNDRGVYMHDTIIPAQLARSVRAEGQQEPRVANPKKLAGLLLAEGNGWSEAKVASAAKGTNAEVKLDRPIPVHMAYFTVVVDEQGQVKTFDDIYKLDAQEKPDDAAAASPPVAGSAPVPVRKPVNGSLAATVP